MTITIPDKIVGWEVLGEGEDVSSTAVPPESVLAKRPPRLLGSTYKIQPPTLSAALYITVNDIEMPDGSKRPFEIFLNTKDVSQQQWMVLATRLISAIFRTGQPFEFILDEMKQVFDAKGSYFLPFGAGMCGGVVAHIGIILEEHCRELGMSVGPGRDLDVTTKERLEEKAVEAEDKGIPAQQCYKCGELSMYIIDGCLTCQSCGESKCG